MHVVRLTSSDRNLLCARFAEHGNSFRRMLDALCQAGADDAGARLAALRRIERRFDVDLAEICHRHGRRHLADTHPIERLVLDFITEERHCGPDPQLWIMPDRVHLVRQLKEGKLVGGSDS
jgi:hypothetical protein